MRTTQTRTPNFAYFQGPQAQTQVQGVDGEVAYNVGANGTPARASAAVAADRRAEQFHHPLRLLRVALAADAKLSAVRTEGAERLIDVTTDAGPITLAVGADGKPTRIQSPGSHINLGDVVLTTTLRRLRRRRRAAAADAAGHPGGRLHHRHLPGEEHRRGHRHRWTRRPRRRAPPLPAAPAVNVAVEEVAPGRVVPGRAVASQRGRRLQGSPGDDRSAAERGADAGGHRQGARAAPRHAAHPPGDVAPPLRPLDRAAGGDRRRADHRHPGRQRGVREDDGRRGRSPAPPTRWPSRPSR